MRYEERGKYNEEFERRNLKDGTGKTMKLKVDEENLDEFSVELVLLKNVLRSVDTSRCSNHQLVSTLWDMN